MVWYWVLVLAIGTALVGLAAGFVITHAWWQKSTGLKPKQLLGAQLENHFRPLALKDLTISERRFPYRVRADLQQAMDRLFTSGVTVRHFCGVRREYAAAEGINFAALIAGGHYPAVSVPPEYEDVDVGEEWPIRVVKNALWLFEQGGQRYAVLLSPAGRPYGETTGVQFQVAAPNSPEGTRIAQAFFRNLEEAILQAQSYRGKILSLELAEHHYSGESAGITVHRLRTVAREDVILPAKTLELLERNVVQFTRKRKALAGLGLSTKKGLLFYGPPGTGKTHTIHFLTAALQGHTTLLISADQVKLLAEYMTLARLLQPSIVVLEDVDLIARDREAMAGPCQESMLNSLLNEMDGLKEEADVLFILTTNRPEALEAALASRPGRVDQAIEFPLPDDTGRDRLIRLYARGMPLADAVVRSVVTRTDGVSAAFIKELMRRSAQYRLERNGTGDLELSDVERALEEMLFSGGSLNLKLLGAGSTVGRGFGFAGTGM